MSPEIISVLRGSKIGGELLQKYYEHNSVDNDKDLLWDSKIFGLLVQGGIATI